jgi:DNA-binding transcriptional LysR family regulator
MGAGMQVTDRIGRRIKLQDLHVLMTVVQAGSMGKAAERLNTVQPAVSRSISELEHALGVRLLDRHRLGVEPTVYGLALLDCGVVVFDDLRQGLKNIEFLADPTAGEARIGSIAPVAASFVAAVINRLATRHPRIVFHLQTADAEGLHRALHDRAVDLVVGRQVGGAADKWEDFELLFDDSHVVAVGARSPWVRRRKIELADLANEPWVLPPPETFTGSVALRAFRDIGLDYPRVTLVTNSLEVRMSLLSTGCFLAVLPMSILRFPNNRSKLKVLPVALRQSSVPVGIVTLKNRTLSPVARLFMEHAREVARSLKANR